MCLLQQKPARIKVAAFGGCDVVQMQPSGELSQLPWAAPGTRSGDDVYWAAGLPSYCASVLEPLGGYRVRIPCATR